MKHRRNYNNSLMMSALTVIPSVIGVVGTLNSLNEAGTLAKIASTAASGVHSAALGVEAAATSAATSATAAFDAVLDANPIILVVLAIAGLTAIVWAYENCKPFRDVINELGGIVGGSVLALLTV